VATDSTNLLIYYASQAIDMLYKTGYNFHKVGMYVTGIGQQTQVQSYIYSVENK
jgi:hypothetical protein